MLIEPLERANRPADFIKTLCRSHGWNGEVSQIEHAMGHHGVRLVLKDFADAITGIGLRPVARSCRLKQVTQADLPCLYEDRNGEVRLIQSREAGMLRVVDQNGFEPFDIKASSERVILLHVETPEAEVADGSGMISTLFREHSKAVWGVIMASAVINGLGISTPLVVLTVYDTAIPTQSVPLLWSLAALASILITVELALRILRAWLIGDAGAHIEQALSCALFRKLSHLPVQQLSGQSLFQQITRLKQFDSIREALTGSFIVPCLDLPFALIFLGTIAYLSKTVGLVLFGALFFFSVLAFMLTKWQLRVSARTNSLRSYYETLQHEIARNRRMIADFDMIESFKTRARAAQLKAESAAFKQRMMQTTIQSVTQGLVGLLGVGLVCIATLQAMAGDLTFGGLIVIVTLVWRIFSPFQALMANGPRLVGLVSSLRQIDAVLAQEEEMRRVGSHARSKKLNAPLVMKNVFLQFDAVHEPALANVSVEANRGELIALCGPTRSGKTCLLNCLAKMVIPGSGSVTIDSIDYRQLAVEDIRQAASYCTHDNWFFDMTLRENMQIGNPSLTDQQIVQMLTRLGAHGDLRRFRQGLDTMVTADVIARLSTVQLKTLSIARTLCRTSPIYLIDDAMVGLSATRGNRVWETLEALRGKHTIIAVTNHVDQIARADRMICLNKGRVAVDGAGQQDANAAAAFIQGV